MTIALLLVFVTCFLAYSNGANDNFKGVASLFGSGTTDYRRAIWWATVTTLAGSIVSLVAAQSLLMKFSGRGIVPNDIAVSEAFLLAVALGAGLTVILATLAGLPISTTHALTGGILGAGAMAVGGRVNLDSLGRGFLMPLAFSPLIAVGAAAAVYGSLRFARRTLGITKEWCVCVGETHEVLVVPQPGSAATLRNTGASDVIVSTGDLNECKQRYAGSFLGLQVQTIMDAAHFLSAGIVCFARGLNDTPKIAAMLLVVQALDIRWGMAAIGAAMATGGLLSASRVAETMSHRITAMDAGEGLGANLSTGFLVVLATRYGLPVSTTHVSVGSLFGIGLLTGRANVGVVLGIALSWVLTLPCAALISGVAYWVASRVTGA
jgi:PiT family inorganic phosphate transporter